MASILFFLNLFIVGLCAIPLSVDVPANARKCFYVKAHRDQAKIRASFSVIYGGNFDIDATLSQDSHIIQSAFQSESNEWLLQSNGVGEYELCFFNQRSTYADKLVEFEFEVETNTIEAKVPDPANEAHTVEMERHIQEIDLNASSLSRKLVYLRNRNSRNEYTVKSTSNRIWWFTVLELFAIVGMAIFNVTIVQIFFKGARKNIV